MALDLPCSQGLVYGLQLLFENCWWERVYSHISMLPIFCWSTLMLSFDVIMNLRTMLDNEMAQDL